VSEDLRHRTVGTLKTDALARVPSTDGMTWNTLYGHAICPDLEVASLDATVAY
jgi:hypothetical protein